MSSDGLLSRIAALRTENRGGERFARELASTFAEAHPDDLLYTLRWLYTEVDDGRRSLVRWAHAQLDAEVSELEDLGLAI